MTSDDIDFFDKVLATFRPSRTDDLTPEAACWIGWRGVWSASWIVERGQYEGQWAMMPLDPHGNYPPFAWMPFCDLADIDRESP